MKRREVEIVCDAFVRSFVRSSSSFGDSEIFESANEREKERKLNRKCMYTTVKHTHTFWKSIFHTTFVRSVSEMVNGR